jgi:hypothetical protein
MTRDILLRSGSGEYSQAYAGDPTALRERTRFRYSTGWHPRHAIDWRPLARIFCGMRAESRNSDLEKLSTVSVDKPVVNPAGMA